MKSTEKSLLVPALGRSWNPVAAPRALNERSVIGLWRDFSNFRIHWNYLQRRPAVQRFTWGTSLGSLITLNGNQSDGATTVGYNGQSAMWFGVFPEANVVIVVTDREIWQWEQGRMTWVNLTPIYNLGTVTITTGTATLTGSAAALWQDRFISPGQLVELPAASGDWYVIKTVDSNTQITLKDNYTGANLAGDAYTIRRTFFGLDRLAVDWPIFGHVINGDLFLAGTTLGGANVAAANQRLPAVIKVTDVLKAGVTNADSAYIYAQQFLSTASTPQRNVNLQRINGFQPVDDGRVAMVTRETIGGAASIFTRLRYNSHTDPLEWNTSPSGFYDINALAGEGLALGKQGRSLTIHTPYGISYAHMTGEENFPFYIQSQPVTEIGCGSPRTLRMTRKGEVFLSADFQVYVFDGTRARPVGNELKEFIGELGGSGPGALRRAAFARLDTFRGEYCLFFPVNWREGDTSRVTYEFVFDLETEQWTKNVYPGIISAASDVMRHSFTTPNTWDKRSEGHSIISYPSYDPDVTPLAPALQTAEDLLFYLSESAITDVQLAYTNDGSQGFFLVASDDFDFGFPGLTKSILRIKLWIYGLATGTDTIEVSLSKDQGVTKLLTKTVAVSLTSGKLQLVDFDFDTDPDDFVDGEEWRMRVEVQSTTTCRSRIDRYRWSYMPRTPVERI